MSTLDNVEQCDEKDYIKENTPGVALKGGIDMRDLWNLKDTEFELNEEDLQPTDEMQDVYFDKEKHFQQLNYECLNCGDDDDPATPFQRMAREMEDISPNKDGSVMKSIIHHGAGMVVPSNSLCRVHYNAYKELDDEPFDSSYLRNRQKQFKLGQGETILGWEIGVPTMKRGETARFLFSPDYGYGKLGCPPRIPANAWTMFEIQLISFVDQEAADNYENFSKEEQKKLSFDEIVKVSSVITTNRYKLYSIALAGSRLMIVI
jgi:FK506-binding protein 6